MRLILSIVTPYLHNGSELKLDVVPGKGVICNLFTDNPTTNQRITWRNVELKTVVREDKVMYCIKTSVYNHVAKHDDRRAHERVLVQGRGYVFDGQNPEGMVVVVHDISDIGISFYAPKDYTPKSNQLTITFSDLVDDKFFEVKVGCTIVRTTTRAGNMFVGCRVSDDNRDYQVYSFMKRLWNKNKNKQ